MTSPKTCILAAVAGVLAASAAFADTDVQQQIADLKSQVAQLEARQAAGSKEMAATIDAVLRDAEHRSQLAADMGGGAGHDENGFFIRGGAFELRPNVLLQFSNITDYRKNTAGKGTQIENGFEVHRAEFGFSGTAFTKELTYNFLWTTLNDDPNGSGTLGSVTLLDAYATYMFNDDMGVRAGQFTANVTHEETLSDGKLLATERSLFDAAVAGYEQRVQGVALLYGNYNDKNPVNAEVAFTDGANSLNSNFQTPGESPAFLGQQPANWGAYARVEYKASGSWINYQDMTAKGVKKDNLLVLGGAVSWDQYGDGDEYALTMDGTFKTAQGLSLYGAGIIRHGQLDMSGAGAGDIEKTNEWGYLLQAAYLVNPQIELFARYSYIAGDWDTTMLITGAPTNPDKRNHEITLGTNYYMGKNGEAGHRAKITVDLDILPKGTPADEENLSLGYQGGTDNHLEMALRAQFQLML